MLTQAGSPVTMTDQIEAFIREHRDHGQVVGDAAEPMTNVYEMTITCPCRVVFRSLGDVDRSDDRPRGFGASQLT